MGERIKWGLITYLGAIHILKKYEIRKINNNLAKPHKNSACESIFVFQLDI